MSEVEKASCRTEDIMDQIVCTIPDSEWLTFAHNSKWLRLDDDTIDKLVPDIENITKMQKYKLLKMWKKENGVDATSATLENIFRSFMQQLGSQKQFGTHSDSQQTENFSVTEPAFCTENMAGPFIAQGVIAEPHPRAGNSTESESCGASQQAEQNMAVEPPQITLAQEEIEAAIANKPEGTALPSHGSKVKMEIGSVTTGQFVGFIETNNYS